MRSVGIGLDCRLGIGSLTGAAKLAEKNGFEAAWAIQYFYGHDPFVVLAAVASSTESMRVGTAITNVYERHPLTVALSTASVDEIAGGRMTLGLGVSAPKYIAHEMGIPYSRPRVMLREAVSVIRAFLRGDDLDFEGEFVHVHGVTMGFKPAKPAIPINLAAIGPKAIELAAEIADGVVLNYGTTPEYVSYAVRTLASHRPSSKFEITSLLWAIPEPSKEDLVAAKRRLAIFYSNPGFGEQILPHIPAASEPPLTLLERIRKSYSPADGRTDVDSAAALITDEVLNSVMLIGRKGVESRLDEYAAAGLDHPIIVPLGGEKQLENVLRLDLAR